MHSTIPRITSSSTCNALIRGSMMTRIRFMNPAARTITTANIGCKNKLLHKHVYAVTFRSFSTSPPNSTSDHESNHPVTGSSGRALNLLERARTTLMTRNGAIVATGVLALLVTNVAYKTMHAFIHLDFYTVAEIGFVSGLLSAGATVAGVNYAMRAVTISPEQVLTRSFDMIRTSPGVLEMMGVVGLTSRGLSTGVFRAYQVDGGKFGFQSGMIKWRRPSLQLTYQIYGGDEKQAVVVVDASKDSWGNLVMNFISVDLLKASGDGPTVIVIGDEIHFKIRDDLRTYVTLNRRYVKGLAQASGPAKLSK